MKPRTGSLTDIASSVMTNKSEKEIERIKKESVVRRSGTLEDQISNMMRPKPPEKPESQEENS